MTWTEPVEDLETAAGKAVDVPKLLAKCEELVGRFQYDLAIKFCERILEHEPQQLDALQMKATILIDAGETDQAKEVCQPVRNAPGPDYYRLAFRCS